MPVIYIDVLFAENLIIDLVLICCCGKLADAAVKKSRVLCGALVAALYSCALVFESMQFLFSPVMRLAASATIVAASFKMRGVKQFLRLILTFYITCFIFGGLVTAAIYFTDFGGMSGGVFLKGAVYFPFSVFGLFMSVFTAAFLVYYFVKYLKHYLLRRGVCCTAAVSFCGKSVTLDGLIDTGNTLRDPSGGMEVAVADKGALLPLFNENLAEFAAAGDIASIYEQCSDEECKRWRIVPYSTVSGTGVMLAFKPDSVEICMPDGAKSDINCLVGISKTALCAGDCKIILGSTFARKG